MGQRISISRGPVRGGLRGPFGPFDHATVDHLRAHAFSGDDGGPRDGTFRIGFEGRCGEGDRSVLSRRCCRHRLRRPLGCAVTSRRGSPRPWMRAPLRPENLPISAHSLDLAISMPARRRRSCRGVPFCLPSFAPWPLLFLVRNWRHSHHPGEGSVPRCVRPLACPFGDRPRILAHPFLGDRAGENAPHLGQTPQRILGIVEPFYRALRGHRSMDGEDTYWKRPRHSV